MDFQLTAIIAIFGLLIILDKIEKKSESSESSDNSEGFVSHINKGYTNPSVLLNQSSSSLPYSVNYTPTPNNFGNFGTIGSFPPNPLCLTCDLQSNSVTAPYIHSNDLGDQSGELHGKLARSCGGIYGKNYSDLNRPLLVAARSTGRPRQCRRIL